MPAFAHRGVVEGFYGPPWSHRDRLFMLERMGRWGMNRYLYAPKDDPLQRREWRTPYPEQTLEEFRELVACGEAHGVRVGFAVSPGVSISYASADDRHALADKFESLQATGARLLSLALDDVPSELQHAADRKRFESLAHAHTALSQELLAGFAPETSFVFVPTDYLGREPSAYLEVLGAELPAEVEVAWTGRTIVSPDIRSDEAAPRAQALGRKLLIWDNVPVSDGPMRPMLHLGPYGGRDPGLVAHCSGVLLNPMQHAHASAVALHTAARWLDDPASYDPGTAWRAALEEVGEGDPDALRTFALAHRFSPLWPDSRDDEFESAFERLVELLESGRDLTPALDELRARVDVRLGVAERIRERLVDRKLVAEIEPWLASHLRETRRMEAALNTARTLLAEGPGSEKVYAFMGMEGRLTREPENGKVSYGPRRVLYPQLQTMRDEDMGLTEDPALFRDRNLADQVVEFVEDLALWLLQHKDS
jgi:hyaluronoglucosaminidase